jgi:hypothetical protein
MPLPAKKPSSFPSGGVDELSPPFFGGLFSPVPQTEFPMRSYLPFPKPIEKYPYLDKIQFWVPNPLNREELAVLERACGPGNVHIENRPGGFNNHYSQYGQKIELCRPSRRALRLLARLNDVLINRLEITLDLIFKYREDVDEGWDFLHQHLVRRWRRQGQEIRVFRSAPRDDDPGAGETRYDAGREVPNRLVVYSEDHTRATGEPNCLHVEWRLNGLRAIRAAGIKSGQDLLEFDHRAFWQDRLRLYMVNRRKLGRLLRNRLNGTRRRTPEILRRGRYGYDVEGRTGEACARSFETVQELIDKVKSSIRIHRALIRIPNDSLLPE